MCRGKLSRHDFLRWRGEENIMTKIENRKLPEENSLFANGMEVRR